MLKKYKQFVLGVLAGAILFSGAVFAANGLNIKANPYPVLINGQASPVSGYNIDGYTFLKLADFKKAGLKVIFNESDSQIEITSVSQNVYNTPISQVSDDTSSNNSDSIVKKEPHKISYIYIEENGQQFNCFQHNDNIYISPSNINLYITASKLHKKRIDTSKLGEGIYYLKTQEEVQYDKSKLFTTEKNIGFELEYFKNTFIPNLENDD